MSAGDDAGERQPGDRRPPLEYKFVELSQVTDADLERVVNHWVSAGWTLDDIRFVTTEHSRRPAMAFISFTRVPVQTHA